MAAGAWATFNAAHTAIIFTASAQTGQSFWIDGSWAQSKIGFTVSVGEVQQNTGQPPGIQVIAGCPWPAGTPDPAGLLDCSIAAHTGGTGGGSGGGSGAGGSTGSGSGPSSPVTNPQPPSGGTAPPAQSPVTGPEDPPAEGGPFEECWCEPIKGVMGIDPVEKVYEEKNLYFPKSNECDDPSDQNPIEKVRKLEQDVEWVPIIEIPRCMDIPPREEEPPPPEDNPPIEDPVTGDPNITGGSSSPGASPGGAPGSAGAGSGGEGGGSGSGSGGQQQNNAKPNGKPGDRQPSGGKTPGNNAKDGRSENPYSKPAPCSDAAAPKTLRRMKAHYESKVAEYAAMINYVENVFPNLGRAAKAAARGRHPHGLPSAEFLRKKREHYEAKLQAYCDKIDAWKEKCAKRAAEVQARSDKEKSKGGAVDSALAGNNADQPNQHDFAASLVAGPNQISKPGDWHRPYNANGDGGNNRGLPSAVELPAAMSSFDGRDEGENNGGKITELAGMPIGPRNKNSQGQDTPCRYAYPVPTFEGKEAQHPSVTINPHNTPTDLTQNGYPFAVNPTPLISSNGGPITDEFFKSLARGWEAEFPTGSGDPTETQAKAIADEFAKIVDPLTGDELQLDAMAQALLKAMQPAGSTNEDIATAKQLIQAQLLDNPKYLLQNPNPAYDHRFNKDTGAFIPSSNKANAHLGIPVAAPTPVSFNVDFDVDTAQDAPEDYVDTNTFRDEFDDAAGAETGGGGAGSVTSSGDSGIAAVTVKPTNGSIIVTKEGLALPFDDGRLQRGNFDTLWDRNANDGLTQDYEDLESQLVTAQGDYEIAFAAHLAAFNVLKADPDNVTKQTAEAAALETLRDVELEILLLEEDIKKQDKEKIKQPDVGLTPDPNPSGYALPQPFISKDMDKPIPTFSFETLQYENESLIGQVEYAFKRARKFIDDLRSEMLDSVRWMNREEIAYQRDVNEARLLRQAATAEYETQLERFLTLLGGGINNDGSFSDPLTDAALQDSSGNPRYSDGSDSDRTAVDAALQLAYTAAGMNTVAASGTTVVPPTDGSDLTDAQIASEAGIAAPSNIPNPLPDDLLTMFDDIMQAAFIANRAVYTRGDLNDVATAREIARKGMRDNIIGAAIYEWLRQYPIKLPKKLGLFLFGGTASQRNFDGRFIETEYRGVLDRSQSAKIDAAIQLDSLEKQIATSRSTIFALQEDLRLAQAVELAENARDINDVIRQEAELAVRQISDQLSEEISNRDSILSQMMSLMREEDTGRNLPAGLLIEAVLGTEKDQSTAADGITFSLEILNSLTTQWAEGQNTGFEADRRDYLFKGLDEFPLRELNAIGDRALLIRKLFEDLLDVAVGRYKLIKDTVQNSDDPQTVPIVVDVQPGVIGDSTPESAPLEIVRPLRVVYDTDARDFIVDDGKTIGGGMHPGMSELPMFSLNPEFAVFTTNKIQEQFTAQHSWDEVEQFVIPELLVPGSTSSQIPPSPNAIEVKALVTHAPFRLDLIITVPDYVAGEIKGQILNSFHTLMRHYVGLFNASPVSQGVRDDGRLNTQISVGFLYGNYDTYRLPRPLHQFNRLLGSNEAGVSITMPGWSDLYSKGYNWGSYGDLYFDIAYKALVGSIKWARKYASNVEIHLNQSVRAKMPSLVFREDDPEKDLDNPNNLDDDNSYDFRITTTVPEIPDGVADEQAYMVDVDIDFGDGYASLDIDQFGYIDSNMVGRLRQAVLRQLTRLETSDEWNNILFGGEQVITPGQAMFINMHPVSSWDINERPFSNDNPPHIGFTFTLGWNKTVTTVPSNSEIALRYHGPDDPRKRVVMSSGKRNDVITTTTTAEEETFLSEGDPMEFPDYEIAAEVEFTKMPDVLTDGDLLGEAIERWIQKLVYNFMKSVQRSAENSFQGMTLLWPVNYGMISQSDLSRLVDYSGESRYPRSIETLNIGNRTILVYPQNQPVTEQALRQSTFSNKNGPLTDEFQKTDIGVIVTPSRHGEAPQGSEWIRMGSNFGSNIPFSKFVDQLDAVLNLHKAYFAMQSRGEFSGQHVMAKVISKQNNEVTVVPVIFNGNAAATALRNGRLKVSAKILGDAADIKVGDQVFLSYDLSKNRQAFVWTVAPKSMANLDVEEIDIPCYTQAQLDDIEFLGQNVNGQFDGSGLVGNIFTNAIPSLVDRVNRLLFAKKQQSIIVFTKDIDAGVTELDMTSAGFTAAPTLLIQPLVHGAPTAESKFATPKIYSLSATAAVIHWRDTASGDIITDLNSVTNDPAGPDDPKIVAIGPTDDLTTLSNGKIVPADLFKDAGARS